MHARVDTRVGDQRRNDAQRDPGLRPRRTDTAGEGGRGMARGPGRGARHYDLAGDWDVLDLPVGPAPVAERLQHQVHDGRREGDGSQAVLRGARAAACGEQGGAAEKQPRMVRGPGDPAERHAHGRSRRGRDRRVEPLELIGPSRRAERSVAVGRGRQAVNVGCDEARRVWRRFTLGRGSGIHPCDPCLVETDFARYRCGIQVSLDSYTGRVTCRRDEARVVTWRYSFQDE